MARRQVSSTRRSGMRQARGVEGKAATGVRGGAPRTKGRQALGESIEKAPTGIHGVDQITGGGLPKGRPTLVCGGPGCGKTLMAMEFLVRGATEFDEPGVFVSFEESAEELVKNVASLGFDLDELTASGRMVLDQVRVERREIEETGEYDLEALFIRLGYAIDSIGAKRIVLDTIESLFSGFTDTAVLRAELRRLFRWLKDRGMTTVITGERGEGQLTRQGLEEYVSDCVILLDHRVSGQVSTRRMRIVKYRGSTHGTSEYPFLIDEDGISVMPITSLGLDHGVSSERVSTGVPRLDEMLGGGGYYRGSSVLITGTAGTGKTTIAAHFAGATCDAGERCLYLAFEESRNQVIRNMRSVGLDLEPHVRAGRLKFFASRPTMHGLEMHLVLIHKMVEEFRPTAVIIDPVTSLLNAGEPQETEAMLLRVVDHLKTRGITSVFTSLTSGGGPTEWTEVGMSSLMDTWLLLRELESGGERNRGLYILKSRGMAHSNQVREFVLTSHGIELRDVYVGPAGVLIGSERAAQEAEEEAQRVARQAEGEARRRALERKRRALEAQTAAMLAELEAEEAEAERARVRDEARQRTESEVRTRQGATRSAAVRNNSDTAGKNGSGKLRTRTGGAR